jgi:hypothetical protein
LDKFPNQARENLQSNQTPKQKPPASKDQRFFIFIYFYMSLYKSIRNGFIGSDTKRCTGETLGRSLDIPRSVTKYAEVCFSIAVVICRNGQISSDSETDGCKSCCALQ